MIKINTRQIQSYLVPLAILVLSFLLRLCLISKGPFHGDTANLIIKAEETLATFRLQSLFGFGYPLAVILGACFIFLGRLFSSADSVFAVNFMSVFFSSLSIWAFYFLVKDFLDERTAVFSSILFSVCPIFLGLSVYGKSHAPAMFFLLAGLFYLLRYLRINSRKDFIAAVILFGLLGATRVQDLILTMPAISWLFFMGRDESKGAWSVFTKKQVLCYLTGCLFAGLIVVLFHLPFLLQQHKDVYLGGFSSFLSAGLSGNFMGMFLSHALKSCRYFLQTFTGIGVLFSIVGLILLGKKNIRIFGFLVCWIIVPFVFYGNLNAVVSRFYVLILPPLIISQGYVFAQLAQGNVVRRVVSYCVYAMVLIMLFLSIYPVLKIRHEKAILPDFARWVGSVTEENACVIVTDEMHFIKYFARRKPVGRPRSNAKVSEQDLLSFKQRIDSLLDQNIPVYIATNALLSYDKDQHFSDFFLKHYEGCFIGSKDYEGWYRGEMELQVVVSDLYKIRKK